MTQPPSSIGAETLSAYLERSLAPTERAQIEAQIERDPSTAKELAELQTMLSALANMPQECAPRGFSERVVRTVRRRRWLQDAQFQGQAALVFQILSIIVVVGIAAAVMIAHFEADDRKVLDIEAGRAQPPASRR